jgi:hypothetical protein
MEARVTTHAFRLRQWIEIVSQCYSNGKTVKAWCKLLLLAETGERGGQPGVAGLREIRLRSFHRVTTGVY